MHLFQYSKFYLARFIPVAIEFQKVSIVIQINELYISESHFGNAEASIGFRKGSIIVFQKFFVGVYE